jgi:hypothetical protein
MSIPLDLQALASSAGYRTTLDPTAEIESDRSERCWLVRIPCRYGFISPWSATDLAVHCKARRLFSGLLEIPTARVVQRGDKELRVVFDPQHLDAVAKLLKAQRKRTVSASERKRLTAIGAASRFARR